MKYFFLQGTCIKAKLFAVTGLIILFVTAFFSPAYSGIQNSFIRQLKDTSVLDSVKDASTVIVTADSSKMFTSLLSSTTNSSGFDLKMNAEARYFIDDYIKKNTVYFNNMKVWGKPYFDLYDRILTSYGVPVQLKYLSVIESSLNSNAVSWAGAAGPWQIMSSTAREHGLRSDYYVDDRSDYVKSTIAACKILKELYNDYGDWLLVIAAYNAGSGSVNNAIAKAHSKNFWDIQYYLPLETRNHVKKFIATHYFFDGNSNINNGNDNSNTALQNKDSYLDVAANATTINLYGKYNSVIIANNVMMDITLFNQLNPNFDETLARGDVYPLRIPADKLQLFQAKKIDILKQSVELLLSTAGPSATAK